MTELLQRADFELAVLIGVVMLIVVGLVVVARRSQPVPMKPAGNSSAVPADLDAMEAKIKLVEGRLSEVEHGVNQVRTMLNALPTKDSVHGIALKVAELQGDLKVNNAATTATSKSIERIEEWIMRLDEKATTR